MTINRLQTLKTRLAELEAAIAETEKRLPAHSIKPPVMHELLDLEDERGLLCLPEPNPGDIFFDIEAARFYEGGGLEYLFGWCQVDDEGQLVYRRRWGHTRAQEKRAKFTYKIGYPEEWRDAVGYGTIKLPEQTEQ